MLKQKTVHATKILSVPHFFHGQSSPPETLAQCAEATFFFREKLWFGIHRIFGAGEEQKNTMDASMMMKLMGLIDVFFFPFLLDDCTWKLHQVAFPWGHKQKLEKKRWKGSYDESISLSILIETFGVFWLLKLRDPKDCFVMLHCHVWWCIGCKGCANWSQSPSKVPAVPPGTQAAWAGGTRGCMKPYKIGGARLVRWVWEAHLPWLAAYLSKRTAESIMRSRKTDPISRHHPDSVFSSLILIVFTMNRWHSSTTLYYSDVFSNCDFPIHWQVKHCSHEDPMASEWACSDTSDRLDLESYEAMKLSVTLSG